MPGARKPHIELKQFRNRVINHVPATYGNIGPYNRETVSTRIFISQRACTSDGRKSYKNIMEKHKDETRYNRIGSVEVVFWRSKRWRRVEEKINFRQNSEPVQEGSWRGKKNICIITES